MKMQTLRVLAAVATPLIATGSARAGFLGVKATSKPNDLGLLTVNIYAIFDRPDPGDGSGDHMVAVAGSPNAPINIEVIGGVFFNSPFGGDQAPNFAFIDCVIFPSLCFDTFVTIGVNAVGVGYQPQDELVITPGFPTGITGSSLYTTTAGWAVIPTAPQGDPFDPANSFPGNGQILIGQFSTLDGSAIQGTMLLHYVSNGVSHATVETFFLPGPGGLAMLGVAGLIGRRRCRRRDRRP